MHGANLLNVWKMFRGKGLGLSVCPGLLKLHERRVVLKYLEKLEEKIATETEEQKVPEWCNKVRSCNETNE
jgi:hypothetical protein